MKLIVLDTHGLTWWIESDRRLSVAARRAIDGALIIGVPAIVLVEIGLLVDRGKVRLPLSLVPWVQKLNLDPRVRVLAITAEIAVSAHRWANVLESDLFDMLIFATAMAHDAPLVTKDGRMPRVQGLRTIW